MAKKFVDQAVLARQMVTDADAFTRLRAARHLEKTPALQEIAETGEGKLPGMPAVLADVYHTLWTEESAVRDDVPTDRRYVAEVLRGAMATSAYEALHAQTKLSDLKSLLGTLTMGDSIVARVSEEDAEKLQKSAEAQAEADEAEVEAKKAEAEADAAEGLSDEATQTASGEGQGDSESEAGNGGAQGDAGGQSQGGQPSGSQSGTPSGASQSGSGEMSVEQAQAFADELAKQATEVRAKAQKARTVADKANAQAETVAEELFGQPGSKKATEKLQELARIGLAAAKEAQAEVEEVSETLQSWGFEEGELTHEGIPEALATLKRIQNNKNFKDFAKLLGRVKRIAAKKARSKDKSEGVKVTRQETGRDIRRAVRSELVALTGASTRTKTLTRWARGELRLYGEEAKPRLGEGPVVVCEDSSGSMDGAKQQWAKATVLALAHYAKLRKRSFVWIMFDGAVQRSKFYPQGRLMPKDILEIAESRSGGGTEFQPPLDEAMRHIREEGLKKADIAFITDGDSWLDEEFLDKFNAARKSLEINVFSVLCDQGHTSDSTVGKFSEQVLQASAFSDDDAIAVIGQL